MSASAEGDNNRKMLGNCRKAEPRLFRHECFFTGSYSAALFARSDRGQKTSRAGEGVEALFLFRTTRGCKRSPTEGS